MTNAKKNLRKSTKKLTIRNGGLRLKSSVKSGGFGVQHNRALVRLGSKVEHEHAS
jgi:hypothetical protein